MSDQVALHYTNSTLRERIVEHVFVGEALRALWRRGIVDVEVLRAEFDGHGYDLVMSRGKVMRHIQFKTGTRPKPLRKVIIARAMEAKPSGCVLWINQPGSRPAQFLVVRRRARRQDSTAVWVCKRTTHWAPGKRQPSRAFRSVLDPTQPLPLSDFGRRGS